MIYERQNQTLRREFHPSVQDEVQSGGQAEEHVEDLGRLSDKSGRQSTGAARDSRSAEQDHTGCEPPMAGTDSGDGGSRRPESKITSGELRKRPKTNELPYDRWINQLDEHWKLGRDLTLDALDKGKAFLLADGTGKTRQILAIADTVAAVPAVNPA